MPHYIDEIATPLLADAQNCSISYNPEFIAQGEIVKGFLNPDMILVGTNVPTILTPILTDIYSSMTENTPIYTFMTPLEAEIVKISLNGFITTKISFANMISDLCDNVGADKFTVLEAIGADSRIGRKYFNPGLSYGGPCFPRDTKALKQLMDQHNIQSNILHSTTQYNEEHIQRHAAQLVSTDTLLKMKTKDIVGCEWINETDEFIFTNVCYKPGSSIPIIEESAKLKIAEILAKKYNKRIIIRDTEQLVAEVKKEYGSLFEYETDP
jgi:nucleotide sugar dehydrogenase